MKKFTLSVLGVKLLDLSSLRLGVSHYATQHPQLFYTPSNNIHRLYKIWCASISIVSELRFGCNGLYGLGDYQKLSNSNSDFSLLIFILITY